MDPHELENLENMYDTDNSIVEVAQVALLNQDMHDVHDTAGGPVDSPQSCTVKKQVSGRVIFGPLGFMNLASDEECNENDSGDIEEMHEIGVNDVPSADAEDDMDVPIRRELDEDTSKQQNANESKPAAAVGRKRQREFGSPKS